MSSAKLVNLPGRDLNQGTPECEMRASGNLLCFSLYCNAFRLTEKGTQHVCSSPQHQCIRHRHTKRYLLHHTGKCVATFTLEVSHQTLTCYFTRVTASTCLCHSRSVLTSRMLQHTNVPVQCHQYAMKQPGKKWCAHGVDESGSDDKKGIRNLNTQDL